MPNFSADRRATVRSEKPRVSARFVAQKTQSIRWVNRPKEDGRSNRPVNEVEVGTRFPLSRARLRRIRFIRSRLGGRGGVCRDR